MGDAIVLMRDAIVLMGDAIVLMGDAIVLMRDTIVLMGDTIVLKGDAIVLMGDTIVLMGDTIALMTKGVSCSASFQLSFQMRFGYIEKGPLFVSNSSGCYEIGFNIKFYDQAAFYFKANLNAKISTRNFVDGNYRHFQM